MPAWTAISGTSDVSVIPGPRVDFETDQFAFIPAASVEMKVGASHSATAQRLMRPERELLGLMVNIRFKIFRWDMVRAAFGVICVVSSERFGSDIDFDGAERPVGGRRAAI